MQNKQTTLQFFHDINALPPPLQRPLVLPWLALSALLEPGRSQPQLSRYGIEGFDAPGEAKGGHGKAKGNKGVGFHGDELVKALLQGQTVSTKKKRRRKEVERTLRVYRGG